ncbi:ribosome biogenesis GTPase YqeH [Spiroplasma floricola]|uniref:30S ribosome assembly GTPase n=1 Tax=Spiroplasma floricola 23-6 TaxID=1336749 RepID=A0A2K8SE83_9MOLU|nr:ribosome biogenesis GTPase YqeH [Spiroplasma floricola]AUB31548.1 30S ribosome assembly GTPase [Spiroplasma floricola 23-6]
MKFSNKDKVEENDENFKNDQENSLKAEDNSSNKIKQKSKVTLTEATPGIGNTTNFNSKGPKKCIGCGRQLQTTDDRQPGFSLNIEKQDLCLRCFKIKYYNKLVEQEINDQDFINIIDEINSTTKKIRYYYVVDIFDLPGSRMTWLEKLISKKEVIILVNKIDLFPKAVKKIKIFNYIKKFFEDSPIRDSKIILTSSIKQDYVYSLLNELKSVDYDQYIVGISNAGKSSLINACLKLNKQIPSIVTSKYVNTTLDKIKINFTKNNFVYDTPGLVKHNHIAIATAPNYWDFFFFQKEIKQVTYQLNAGQSIFYGGLAWFTFEEGQAINEKSGKKMKTNFHLYINKQMPLHRTKALNAQVYFKKNRHLLAPRLLSNDITFETKMFEYNDERKIDLHISGLGWISFKTYKDLKVSITVPKTEYGIKITQLESLI